MGSSAKAREYHGTHQALPGIPLVVVFVPSSAMGILVSKSVCRKRLTCEVLSYLRQSYTREGFGEAISAAILKAAIWLISSLRSVCV